MTALLHRRLVPILVLLIAACTAAPAPSPDPSTPPSPASTVTATAPATAAPTVAPSVPSPSASPAPSPNPTASAPPTAPPTVAPLPSPGPTTSGAPVDAQLETRLREALEEERQDRGIPGVAAVVVFPDGSRWVAAAGDADLGSGADATPDTPFVIGSITKTFVGALVLQLVDEGRLELDASLDRWLPDYPGARDISLRQLLNHTSGVFNYFEHPRYNSLVFGGPEETWTVQQILNRFRRPPTFAPGQGFRYSNTGFILLGLVVEKVTGNSLGAELRTRFFEPLGLNDTYFQGDGPPPPPESAQGYLRRQSGYREISDGSAFRPTTSAATVAWAAGAIVSSADDLATWGRALYGGDVLSPESLAEMLDVRATPHAFGTYGLATRTRLFQGVRAFGHTGSLRGFMGAVWHIPDSSVTITVLTNLGRFDVNRIADRLAGIVLPTLP